MPTPAVEALSVAITTPRLRLEPIGAHHAPHLFEALRDPALYEWIGLAQSPSVAHLEARWARVADGLATAVDVVDLGWAVQRLEDGAWVGKLDAEVRPAGGIADNVGYLFLRPFWGLGYASEAVAAMVAHLVRRGVVELHAFVTLGNDASGRVLDRCGFARERLIAGNDVIRGVAVDDVEYVRRA